MITVNEHRKDLLERKAELEARLKVLEDYPAQERAAETAFVVARKHDTQVRGLLVESGFQQLGVSVDLTSIAEDEAPEIRTLRKQHFQLAQRTIELFEGDASQSPEMPTNDGAVNRSVPDHASCCNLAALADAGESKKPNRNALSAILFSQSAKPVLIAPLRWVNAEFRRHIVIGWKRPPKAIRAISAAIPLIEYADGVSVLAVGKSKAWLSGGMMSHYLKLHNANTRYMDVEKGKKDPANLLIDHTADALGSTLITGANSHLRWRERVFGGVTQRVLRDTDVPILMRH